MKISLPATERCRDDWLDFRQRLVDLKFEVIKGEHPIVPLMIRDTKKTIELVKYLKDNGILVTGLSYPVVPHGDEEIRFQVCAEHTCHDLDYVLQVLESTDHPRSMEEDKGIGHDT